LLRQNRLLYLPSSIRRPAPRLPTTRMIELFMTRRPVGSTTTQMGPVRRWPYNSPWLVRIQPLPQPTLWLSEV